MHSAARLLAFSLSEGTVLPLWKMINKNYINPRLQYLYRKAKDWWQLWTSRFPWRTRKESKVIKKQHLNPVAHGLNLRRSYGGLDNNQYRGYCTLINLPLWKLLYIRKLNKYSYCTMYPTWWRQRRRAVTSPVDCSSYDETVASSCSTCRRPFSAVNISSLQDSFPSPPYR